MRDNNKIHKITISHLNQYSMNSCANEHEWGEMQIRNVVNSKIFKAILNEKRID